MRQFDIFVVAVGSVGADVQEWMISIIFAKIGNSGSQSCILSAATSLLLEASKDSIHATESSGKKSTTPTYFLLRVETEKPAHSQH